MTTTNATDTPRVLLSVEDAAERLALSRTRLYGLIKSGEIVSIRVGRLRRVPVEALAAFTARLIAEQSRPPDELPIPAPRAAGYGS